MLKAVLHFSKCRPFVWDAMYVLNVIGELLVTLVAFTAAVP
jgi:hypothetical protein